MNPETPKKFQILEKVISQIPPKIINSFGNTMYAGNYRYSLSKYYEILKMIIAKYQTNPLIASITNIDISQYLIWKLQNSYHVEISQNTIRIASVPLVEQKSPEWFRLREDMISASDAGYFLKKCGAGRAMDTLRIKIGLKKYANSTAPPLMHGNTYEDITRAIYESRNKVSVEEYGILPSPSHFIGASPDGIITKCHDPNDWECQARLGRLLEIKNPYSREIDETIKPEYMVQILQQQYTTAIPVCDFVETTIVDKYCRLGDSNYRAYETLEDMLADRLDPKNLSRIKNHNIPIGNLTKFGFEKGVVLWYQRIISVSDIRNRYILYPLSAPYDLLSIEKWVVDMNSTQFNDQYIFKEAKYWRLEVYSEKTVIYDQKLYEEEYIPILSKVWDIIIKCREIISADGDIEQYLAEIETTPGNPFYNDNKVKKNGKMKMGAIGSNRTGKRSSREDSSNDADSTCAEMDYEIDM